MSQFFSSLGHAIAPGQLRQPRESDNFSGTQFVIWKNLVFRPSLFPYEPYLLLAVFGYFVWYIVGRNTNRTIAKRWYQTSLSTIQSQFTLLSPAPNAADPLIADGTSTFLTYASGRRNVLSLHTTLSLIPRPDPFRLLWKFFLFRQWEVQCPVPEDEVRLMLTLLPPGSKLAAAKKEVEKGVFVKGDDASNGNGLKSGTWAVLEKYGLNWARTGRWDLTFPRLASDSSFVPSDLAIMSEHPDVTAQLLSPLGQNAGSGLVELLIDSEARKVFKSLIISDLPLKWPKYALNHPAPLTITLTLRLPVNEALAASYLHVLCNLADSLVGSGPNVLKIQPEISRKFKRTRVDAWKGLEGVWAKEREEEEKDANGGLSKKEKEEEDRRKKKKEEREKLSPKEKAKLEEKEKKKQQRKQQMKMQKR
ncbi:Uncharacterized conserved protein [Phaffia rhodozyma]|uniref:Uncharacterized conserved protein n=1 Tax=Phaffia rhodozyma TaxID=264483 RepID=A0A0F7SP27_PHARH|nr:Uncharacterized conserved protein [Phaffia rhodozyma]